jgi:Asp-tRNA(Asn)/Glu-tRNA(Gln) amidotransferase A subunit family amidase
VELDDSRSGSGYCTLGDLDREAVTASLERIAQVDLAVNAVVDDLAEEALAAAAAAVEWGAVLVPLHGVPVTIKVNVDQKGCATRKSRHRCLRTPPPLV